MCRSSRMHLQLPQCDEIIPAKISKQMSCEEDPKDLQIVMESQAVVVHNCMFQFDCQN